MVPQIILFCRAVVFNLFVGDPHLRKLVINESLRLDSWWGFLCLCLHYARHFITSSLLIRHKDQTCHFFGSYSCCKQTDALGHLQGACRHLWFWQRDGAAVALCTATTRVWQSRCGGCSFCLPAMAPGAAHTVPGRPVCGRVRLPCQRWGDLPAARLQRMGVKTLVDNKWFGCNRSRVGSAGVGYQNCDKVLGFIH